MACPKDVKAWVNRPEDYLWTVDNNIVTVFPVAYQDLYEMIKSTLKVLHAGVTVAELKGKDCIPDHSLAMSTRRCEDCFPVANLTYEQAIAYLRKEAVVRMVLKVGSSAPTMITALGTPNSSICLRILPSVLRRTAPTSTASTYTA